MSEGFGGPPPLVRQVGTARRGGKSPWACLGLGCLGVVVCTGGLVILFIMLFMAGGREIDPFVDEYFRQVDGGQYADIYREADGLLKDATDEATFSAFLRAAHEDLGTYVSKGMRSISFVTSEDTTVAADYQVEFEKGEATVSFRLVKVGDEYALIGVEYAGDVFSGSMPALAEATE